MQPVSFKCTTPTITHLGLPSPGAPATQARATVMLDRKFLVDQESWIQDTMSIYLSFYFSLSRSISFLVYLSVFPVVFRSMQCGLWSVMCKVSCLEECGVSSVIRVLNCDMLWCSDMLSYTTTCAPLTHDELWYNILWCFNMLSCAICAPHIRGVTPSGSQDWGTESIGFQKTSKNTSQIIRVATTRIDNNHAPTTAEVYEWCFVMVIYC